MIRSETRCWEWSGPLPLFLPRPVVRGRGHSLHGALLNALLWDQTHNLNDLRHVLRNVLNRHLRLAIWSQPPKITILACQCTGPVGSPLFSVPPETQAPVVTSPQGRLQGLV